MKKLSILGILISLVSSASLFACNASFASTPKKEWVLDQVSNQTEIHKVYISADAIKIVFVNQGFYVIGKAPDWNAYCYRPEGKKLWIGRFDTFTGDLLINPFAMPKFRHDPLTEQKDVKYAGEICKAYTSDLEGSYVYGSKSISVSPMACEFMCRYYNVPLMHEVPVFRLIEPSPTGIANAIPKRGKIWSTDNQLREERNRRRIMLVTKSIKQVPYNASDFELPKNFVKTRDAGDIGVTGAQRNQIGVALDELGFSSDYVRTEKEKKDK